MPEEIGKLIFDDSTNSKLKQKKDVKSKKKFCDICLEQRSSFKEVLLGIIKELKNPKDILSKNIEDLKKLKIQLERMERNDNNHSMVMAHEHMIESLLIAVKDIHKTIEETLEKRDDYFLEERINK